MCGICGKLNFDREAFVSQPLLKAMSSLVSNGEICNCKGLRESLLPMQGRRSEADIFCSLLFLFQPSVS
jgi:hypothetical protein